ncbi:MAG: MarR family transcriptional regulator [Acetatifactor sp.]|nr:MarR family transcriptional regulator [Acetatifactor sp.]
MENKHLMKISFAMRVIHNQIKDIITKSVPKSDVAPQSQLQGGILGYLFHHTDQPVYQKDIEKEFQISRATATNTLQVMEKNGLILRKSQDKDARLKRITMTEEAAANHARVEAHMQMMDDRMLRGLTDSEIKDLNRYLGVIMNNLEELRKEYSPCGDTE